MFLCVLQNLVDDNHDFFRDCFLTTKVTKQCLNIVHGL